MKKLFHQIVYFFNKSSQDYVTIHAAYSTLFMFISIFPLLMLILSIISYLPIPEDYFIHIFYNITPEIFHSLIYDIVNNLYQSSSGFVLSASAIASLWSSSAGVCGLMYGLNDVYRTYDVRPWIKQRVLCILYTIVLVIIVAASLLLLVCGNQIQLLIARHLPDLANVIAYILSFKYVITFLVFIVFFNLIYFVFPHRKSRFFSHIPGSVVASAGWLILSYVFSIYVDYFANFTMYGSLATIVLFLLWLYIGMCIIFFGGEINAVIADHSAEKEVNEYRKRHEEQVKKLEEEEALKFPKKKLSIESFPLRKSTTRRIAIDQINQELKEEQARKRKMVQSKKQKKTLPENTKEEPSTQATNNADKKS